MITCSRRRFYIFILLYSHARRTQRYSHIDNTCLPHYLSRRQTSFVRRTIFFSAFRFTRIYKHIVLILLFSCVCVTLVRVSLRPHSDTNENATGKGGEFPCYCGNDFPTEWLVPTASGIM